MHFHSFNCARFIKVTENTQRYLDERSVLYATSPLSPYLLLTTDNDNGLLKMLSRVTIGVNSVNGTAIVTYNWSVKLHEQQLMCTCTPASIDTH